jgi:hypothetical protein
MEKILKILSLVGKGVGIASMVDWTSINPKWGVVIFAVSSILKDVINRVGDFLDNQKFDNSYKP